MDRRRILKSLAAASGTAIVSACGGGLDGSGQPVLLPGPTPTPAPTPVPTPTPTPTPKPAPAASFDSYETRFASGVTDSAGRAKIWPHHQGQRCDRSRVRFGRVPAVGQHRCAPDNQWARLAPGQSDPAERNRRDAGAPLDPCQSRSGDFGCAFAAADLRGGLAAARRFHSPRPVRHPLHASRLSISRVPPIRAETSKRAKSVGRSVSTAKLSASRSSA